VCGVAMRENEVVLIADMCHNGSVTTGNPLKFIRHHAKNLPEDAGIKGSSSGRTFKVNNVTIIPV